MNNSNWSLTAILLALLSMAQTGSSASPQISLTAPLDYQVSQRSSRNEGKLVVSGAIVLSNKNDSAIEKIEVRLTGESIFGELPGQWQPLSFDAGTANFRCELIVAAGGWYRLEVCALLHGQTVASSTVDHVGVGEVFAIAGQSNSANYGEEQQTNHTGLVSAFDGAAWRLAGDPEPGAGGKGGSFMPVFGDALVAKIHVPVGIVAQGIGSTSVREWLPSGTVFTNIPSVTRNVMTVGPGQWKSTGKIYTNFIARLNQLGPHGFRAVLWHQGESDANQADPLRTLPGNLYRRFLEQLIRDSRQNIGWDAPWFVAQVSYHSPNDSSSPDIRAAQKALWDAGVALEGPDTDALTGSTREKNGTGVHLSGDGLRAHGMLWAQKVLPWLEHQLELSAR